MPAKAHRAQTTFRIDPELLKTFQHALIDQRLSMTSVIEGLIRSWLSEKVASNSDDPLALFAEQSPAALVIKDLQGTIVWGNPEYERLTATPFANLRGRKISDVWPPPYAAQISAHDRQVAEHGNPLAVLEVVPVDRKEYARFTIRFPIRGPDKSVLSVGAIGCYWDHVVLAELKLGKPVKLTPAAAVAVPKRRRH